MTIRLCGLLLIALSVGNAVAAAKIRATAKSAGRHHRRNAVRHRQRQPGSNRRFRADLHERRLAGRAVGADRQPPPFHDQTGELRAGQPVKPDFIYRAANVTFDGTADSRDPSLLGVYGEAKGWLSSC